MEAQPQGNRGYVTLLATLIVSSFGMALASFLILEAGLKANSAEILERSFHARNFADACAEEALLLITENESYTGSDSLSFDFGECEFFVEADGTESTVQSSGTAGAAIRKVQVVVETETVVEETGTTTTILSSLWTEVEEF